MTRTKSVGIELTDQEILINSYTMYLTSLLLTRKELLKDDKDAVRMIEELLSDPVAWATYCVKLKMVCINAQTTVGI